MFLTLFSAFAVSVGLAAADDPGSDVALDQETIEALSMLDRDPEEFALNTRCLPSYQRIRQRARLSDPVYDARFAWANLTGRDTSVLVEFRRHCDAVRFGQPPIPRCSGPAEFGSAPMCIVEELYIVPDEAHARSLALRILIDEARARGAELPASNADAAQALIDQSNSSR